MSDSAMPRTVNYSGALLKVEWAKQHTAIFERETSAFLGSRPYRVVQQFDMEIDRFAMLVSLTHPMPSAISMLAGDIVHNLRAALDHAICANVAAQGRTIRDTTFPFAKFEADLERLIKTKARKASTAAKQICRDVKPYPGGNDLLAALHELDLIDKHQQLIGVAAAGEFRARYIEREMQPGTLISSNIYYLGEQTEIIPLPRDRSTDVPFEIGITTEIVFGPDTPLAGKPCLAALHELIAEVSRVVAMFQLNVPTVTSDI